MTDGQMMAAATLAAALFAKTELKEGEVPLREIFVMYSRLLRRMETAAKAQSEDDKSTGAGLHDNDLF